MKNETPTPQEYIIHRLPVPVHLGYIDEPDVIRDVVQARLGWFNVDLLKYSNKLRELGLHGEKLSIQCNGNRANPNPEHSGQGIPHQSKVNQGFRKRNQDTGKEVRTLQKHQ